MSAESWVPRAPDCPWEDCRKDDTVPGSCIGRTLTGVELWTFLCRICHRGFTARVARDRDGVHVYMHLVGIKTKWVRELLLREKFRVERIEGEYVVSPQ